LYLIYMILTLGLHDYNIGYTGFLLCVYRILIFGL